MAQLYELLRVRKAGWLVPRYQHAFGRPPRGALSVAEEYVPDLHRHSLVAKLLAPCTGTLMVEIPPLFDVTLLRWSCDLISLTGIERVEDEKGLKVLDCAQTWVLQPIIDEPASQG